jgi:hypothetical protein
MTSARLTMERRRTAALLLWACAAWLAVAVLPAMLPMDWAQARAATSTAACPKFQMFKGSFQSVAGNVDFNGMPMSVESFNTSLSQDDVLAFYRAAWAPPPKQPGPVESTMGQWKIIAMMQGGCFYTVQVMAGAKGGSTGFLGVSAPPSKSRLVKDDVPTMSGSTILNDITHNDDFGKTARSVLLSNGFSPSANATFYQNALAGQGWQMLSGHEMGTRTGDASVMVFKNGAREVSVTAMRDGGDTHVLLNYVDRP